MEHDPAFYRTYFVLVSSPPNKYFEKLVVVHCQLPTESQTNIMDRVKGDKENDAYIDTQNNCDLPSEHYYY